MLSSSFFFPFLSEELVDAKRLEPEEVRDGAFDSLLCGTLVRPPMEDEMTFMVLGMYVPILRSQLVVNVQNERMKAEGSND